MLCPGEEAPAGPSREGVPSRGAAPVPPSPGGVSGGRDSSPPAAEHPRAVPRPPRPRPPSPQPGRDGAPGVGTGGGGNENDGKQINQRRICVCRRFHPGAGEPRRGEPGGGSGRGEPTAAGPGDALCETTEAAVASLAGTSNI